MDRTLILVKPDAFERGLTGEVIARFERKGLEIVALKLMQLERELAERHYGEHAEKPFFRELVEFITRGPLVAMVLQGPSAVQAARQVIGATNPIEAAPGSIRGDHAIEVTFNLVHGSDSAESAERESKLFFPDSDVSLILASRSPQRVAILEMLGVEFDQRPADVAEVTGGAPEEVVRKNALRKAHAVGPAPATAVLGVDTEVFLDGEIFGKARDPSQARDHLRRLSGRTHEVLSGIALAGPDGTRSGVARTTVIFRDLSGGLLDWYLSTGEWEDRAGAYAIQGKGAALIESINGDYWNVVGLPVPLLLDLAPWLIPNPGTWDLGPGT